MTIYTFGDPELLREALLALATIFGLVEWSDPGSALGLGGNMLAVAMIGLLAVAIAGVLKQEIRVDYLLIALVLFGIAFSAKVDVNVEDIQTGTSYVVADVPIGIAAVAAASSSAAASLTGTASTALQRPGVTTSVLTDSGFMDPLRYMLALRDLAFDDLDEYTSRSLLTFYRMCVGNTISTDPALFNVKEFRESDDPLGFMLNTTRLLNFSTVYYSEAAPAGTNVSCYQAVGDLETDTDNLFNSSDEIVAKIRLKLGSKYFNTAIEFSDLEDATDIVSRGTMTGQSFVKAAAMRNFINVAEAWRLAEYGSSEAQYVATVTQSLEEKRVQDATVGTVALQFMFPLMTFMQFLFFTMAPFIALIVIASPFTASKTLGMYFLLGVWAYSWMPVAAVINHYIQITIGNSLEFSDIGAVGMQYTALKGIDSLYDQLSNKIAIGSMALAATPVIVFGLLTASVSGISSLAGKVMGSAKANTSIASPGLAQGRPLVTAGGMGSIREGTASSGFGIPMPSYNQRVAYSQVGAINSLQSGASQTFESAQRASMSLETSRTKLSEAMDSFVQSGVTVNQSSATFSADFKQAFDKAYGNRLSFGDAATMSASERREAESRLQLPGGFFSIGQASRSGSGNASALERLKGVDKSEASRMSAAFGESFSESESGNTSIGGTLGKTARDVRKNQEEYERTSAAADVARTSAQAVDSLTQGGSIELVDLLQSKYSTGDNMLVYQGMEAIVQSSMPDKFEKLQRAQSLKHWNGGEQIRGRDGRSDNQMDFMDRGATMVLALADEAATDSRAAKTLAEVYQYLGRVGGTSVHHGTEMLDDIGGNLDAGRNIQGDVAGQTGEYGDPLQDPVGFNETRALAGDARDMAAQPRQVSSDGKERIRSKYGSFESRAETQAPTGKPVGVFNETETYANAALDHANHSEENITDMARDLWQPSTGFERSAQSGVSKVLNAAEGDAQRVAIQAGLGALKQELTHQLGSDFMHFDPQTTYQGFIEEGFSEADAFVATYASTGVKSPGAGDYVAGALMGAAGFKATKGAPFRLRSTVGVAAIGAGVVGALMVNDAAQQNKEDGLAYLKESYATRFASIAPSEALAESFTQDLQNIKSMPELVDLMFKYKDAPNVSEQDILTVVAPEAARTSSIREQTDWLREMGDKEGWVD